MKILLLSAAKSIHTIKWANAFAAYGHEVFLIYIKGHEAKEDKLDACIHLHQLKYDGSVGYYLNARELSKKVQEIKPDIINVHYASGYGTLARCARLKSYILSIWGSDVYDFPYESKIKNIILKRNVKYARYLASTSNCMAEQLRKVMGDDKLKIAITPFGVDLNLFNPDRFPEKVREKNAPFIIGIVKALEKKYGIEELILAFDELQREMAAENKLKYELRLEIYGDGSEREILEQLIEQKNLKDLVVLKGKIANDKVPEALSNMDVFCALSQLNSESFGVAAVEAMAMKKAVVVSAVDGFREVVVHNQTGIIVPKNNLGVIVAALKKIIENQDMRNKLGENGRKRVEELYDWKKNVNQMLQLYEEVMTEKDGAK